MRLTEEAARFHQVLDLLGLHAHQARAGHVRQHRVPRDDDDARVHRVPSSGPFPSMPTMPSMIASDGLTAPTMSRIEFGDAVDVEDVLRPPVDAARHAPEAVLERERHRDPVMRLELRHRDDEVGVAQHLGTQSSRRPV